MGEAVQEVFESSSEREGALSLHSTDQVGQIKAERLTPQSSDSSDILFHPISKKELRRLARVKRMFFHYTSIDPLGDFVASKIEILDDQIKSDSLNGVVAALTSGARGAPLRALNRALGGPRRSALFPVANVVERSTHCIFGEVAGSEVTIGDEELLLERGVILDSLVETLLEEGQQGFYLLIAIGNTTIARCLITAPRAGDGAELLRKIKPFGVTAQVLSLGASSEAHQCAKEMGLSGETVREVESALHLDALLDSPEPFMVLTSDPDCAEYVARKGLVGLFAEQQRFETTENLINFRSFDLRNLGTLFERAQRQVKRDRMNLALATAGIMVVAAVVSYFVF